MSHSFQTKEMSPLPPGADRRMRGRVRQQGVNCNLGPVIDLSAGGMRVLCTKTQKGTCNVQLFAVDEILHLQAEIVWAKRIGFRRHMLGMKFVNIETATMRKLTNIATNHWLLDPS